MTRTPEDEAGFRSLYNDTVGRVYAFARRHSSEEVAAQVVSDTYLAAWRHWADLPDPPLPWLFRTARNCLGTLWRGEQRRRDLVDVLKQHVTVAEPGPEEVVLRKQHMLLALEELSPVDREALLLVAWDGLSTAQAAESLGITAAAFAARLSRARRRLEAALTTSDDDLGRPASPRLRSL